MGQSKQFSFSDQANFRLFQDLLKTAGYTDSGVIEALGVKDLSSIRESDISMLLQRTVRKTALDTLIRLFLIEVSCDIDAVRNAVQPLDPEVLAEAGIIHIEDTSVRAGVKLLPFKNLLIAFDQPRMLLTDAREGYVMGIGSSTITLANLTVRRQAVSTLDLGTGCGIHAFLAASHSNTVAAVDLNPRATKIASFNAKLNGLENVECLEGDMFSPVKGRKFDLVVTNPPFVISPEKRYIYRDGGMEKDEICRKIVREVPEYLNNGGYCQILCNWSETEGQDWKSALQSWFEGTGCDVWVLRSESRDAATYASTWIQHTEKDPGSDLSLRFDQWMSYYEKHGITAFSAGLITMRRSDNHPNWFRADEAPEKMLGPCGDQIEQGFASRDFLSHVSDDSMLLDARFRIAPDICLDRTAIPTSEGWKDETTRVRLTRGLAYSGNIDAFIANIIVKCNGVQRLGDLFNVTASPLGIDPEKIKASFCTIIRTLVEKGFLLPA